MDQAQPNPRLASTERETDHIEFEVKYRVEGHLLTEFKRVVECIEGIKSFIYVEGPDYYYTKDDVEGFGRFRTPSYGLDNGRKEVTFKFKPIGAKNNIKRTEYNWRVDQTPSQTVLSGLLDLGWEFNFSIWKGCHIYKFEDATLVFYTVYDTTDGKPSKHDSFVEIEVDEELMRGLTEDQAWDIIKKYEPMLLSLGINPQKRLRKSLFEMYRRTK